MVSAGISVFWGCLGVGYFSDDYALLGAVERGVDWRAPLPVGTGGYFRPLLLASFLPGDAPRLQHGLSLLLHLGNGLLVAAVARLAGCRPILAGSIALGFLLHPLVVTNVFWLAGRGDSLCALFYLGGVLAFLGYLRAGSAWMLWATGAAVVLSALAKETGLTLILALGAVWLLLRTGGGGDDGRPLVPPERLGAAARGLVGVAALTVLLALVLGLVFWRRAPAGAWQGPAGPAGVLLVAANAVLLRIDEYDLRRWGLAYPGLRWAGAAAGAALAAGGAAVAFRLAGRRGVLRIALLASLPAAPLLPLLAIGWARERHVYLTWALAMVAVALFLGRAHGGARDRDRLQRLSAWAGLALAPLLAWASIARASIWEENAAYLERSCASFRERLAGAPPDLPVLVIAVPFSRAEAPLYSNDAAEALGYCLDGGFGPLDRLHAYSGLALAKPAAELEPAVAAVDREGTRTFVRRADPREAYFRRLVDRRPGPPSGDELAELRVTGLAPTGDVSAFELAIDPAARGLVLDVAAGGWREVARYE